MRFEIITAVKMSMLVFWVLTSYRNVGIYQPALKMDAIYFSEVFVSIYKSTWRYGPEGEHQHVSSGRLAFMQRRPSRNYALMMSAVITSKTSGNFL
jgi:hypothetical protein